MKARLRGVALRRRLPVHTSSNAVAGLADAGAAAGSTFLAGLIAIRNLEGDVLALYVLVFSATLVAMTVPRQLTYVPSELKANLQPTVVAPQVARDGRRALPFNVLTAAIVIASGFTLFGRVPLPSYLALVLTAAAFAVLSPLQDHLRSALHLVGRHWSAASSSLAVMGVVAATAGATLLAPPSAGAELMPFGALLVGKLLSIALGSVLLRGADRFTGYLPAPFRVRARFLLAEMAVQAAWFGCNLAVLWILSSRAVGDLEAARVVASPLNIVIVGLLTFLNPALLRAMSAGRTDAGEFRTRIGRLFLAVIAASAGYYVLIVLLVGAVTVVFDRPTDLPLVGARLGAVLVEGLSIVIVQLIFAMDRSRLALALSASAAAIGLLVTIALLPLLGEFALPVGQAVGMLVRLVSALVVLERDLRRRSATTPRPPSDAGARPVVEQEVP